MRNRRVFFFWWRPEMPLPVKYNKPPLSFEQQLELLTSRGLAVADKEKAVGFLKAANYYRFSAYCVPFETARHAFIPGAQFEQIAGLYEFDRRLRLLVVEIIEPIEISIRTSIAHHLGLRSGAFGHVQADNFRADFEHSEWIMELQEETERSREVFVRHFKDHYEEYPHLPIWAAVEIMSFGRLSKLFSGLPTADKQAVGDLYEIKAPVLRSWLHSLVYIRNLCAHHARLWNREMVIAPRLPAKDPRWDIPNGKRLAATLYILNWLVSRIPRRQELAADWRGRVEALIAADPGVPNFLPSMGLAAGWTTHPLWRGGA